MIRGVFALVLWQALSGCQRVPDPPVADADSETTRGLERRFSFGTTQGEDLSSASTHGRVTVLVFVTTFDLASQVVAKRLNQVLHTHRPRINAAAVVVEAAKYAPLADVFRGALELSYPVALADLDTLERDSNLGELRSVPTVLVLDRDGREMTRKTGVFTTSDLEGWLARAERP